MQRLKSDRGAVAVIFAILLVPLLVCSALVVDIGAAYSQRRQLQNATDAAALAIAQDCGKGACGDMNATATTFTTANVTSGTASSTPVKTGNKVTVTDASVVNFFFGPVIGMDDTTVHASSTAAWGPPSGGTANLPIVFSWCAFKAQTGGGIPSGSTPTTIYTSKTDLTTCTGPSGNVIPGGFGWLHTDPGACTATSSIDTARVPSDPGRSASCGVADFAALQGKTVLLPIFDTAGSVGNNGWYHIYAYAAFTITGYSFTGQYKWNAPCGGNDSCIRGYFTKFVDPSDAFTYSSTAPDLGAHVISLIA